jgi:ABC-2 type transport system permease protein
VNTLTRTLRALPTLLRVGVAETVAYRAEFLVWILTTTQPLIMMGLLTSVARDGAFHGYTSDDVVAYYLAVLLVRQLTGNWVAWQLSEDIRTGAMAMRLLRPIHPIVQTACAHLAAIPFRSAIAAPLALVLLLTSGGVLVTDHWHLAALAPSLALAWTIMFATLFAIGSLAFWLTQTMAIANLWFGAFSLLSGYLLPLSVLGPVGRVASYLPFRYMLSAPVEIMTRAMTSDELAHLLLAQLGWAAASIAIALVIWRAGVRRFESVGG